jgi:cell division protein FtsZ
VSIDGAKGVLFNVTGGYDMSMSEIQEAAELITGAISPDANIIFGATLKPEVEDEIIITVIATGFDSLYMEEIEQSEPTPTFGDKTELTSSSLTDRDVNSIDMDLDSEPETTGTLADEGEQNMWDAIDSEKDDESDTPAFLRRRKKNKDKKNKSEKEE